LGSDSNPHWLSCFQHSKSFLPSCQKSWAASLSLIVSCVLKNNYFHQEANTYSWIHRLTPWTCYSIMYGAFKVIIQLQGVCEEPGRPTPMNKRAGVGSSSSLTTSLGQPREWIHTLSHFQSWNGRKILDLSTFSLVL